MSVTKQIKDFPLKVGATGAEDILIQDNGVTKRVKASEFLGASGSADLSDYYNKQETSNLLATKSDISHSHNGVYAPTSHTHSEYATKTELNTKANKSDLATVATTGNYNDLTNKPTIPTVDVNKSYVDTELAKKSDASHTHNQYLTSIPTEYVTDTELEDKGYATETFVTNKIAEAQLGGGGNQVDLSGYATKDELRNGLNAKSDATHNHDGNYAPKTHTHSYNDLTDKPTITNGRDGATFTPNVDSDGNLSWTNDGGLQNPTTVNIKGAKGDKGEKGDTGATGQTGAKGDKGAKGDTGATGAKGADGSKWYNGYHCTGTSTSGTVFPNTGISNARVYDMYINTKPGSADLGNIYVCSANGDANTAQWKYSGNIRGAQGEQGIQGVAGAKGDTGATGAQGAKGDKGDKGDKGEDYTEVLITSNSSGGRVTLTADKYQYTSLSNGDTIVLPSVSKFTQIHLYFNATSELTLTFPSVKWQKTPDIQASRVYEFIFTYVNGTWLGGWIAYE